MNSPLSRIIKKNLFLIIAKMPRPNLRDHGEAHAGARISLRNRMVQSLGPIVSLLATKCYQIRTTRSEMKRIQARVYVMEG